MRLNADARKQWQEYLAIETAVLRSVEDVAVGIISTSTCRNFETISSGFGRLFAILGPPFPKHSGGSVQLERLNTRSVPYP